MTTDGMFLISAGLSYHFSRRFRSGWGGTTVDSLTAAILLEIPEAVENALEFIPKIVWSDVSYPGLAIFGNTIRYLGSMLSGNQPQPNMQCINTYYGLAYDLLTTTHQHLVPDGSKSKLQSILTQSAALADLLSPSFNTTHGINSNFLNITDGTLTFAGINDITAISGLQLEWTHLSDLTKNPIYASLTAKSMLPVLNPKPDPPSPFPGLLPKHLNLTDGLFDTNDVGGWSHAGGGLYEMLLKNHVYAPNAAHTTTYLDRWIQAADSTIEHLASHPAHNPDLTFLADFNASTGQLIYQQDHSGMFAAANFLLGGSVTGKQRFTDFGLALVDTYIKLYRSTATGIGPESFGWIPEACLDGREAKNSSACNVPPEYRGRIDRSLRIFITNPRYYLRPEVLESLYYAYRITRDTKYRDASWEIIQDVIKWCGVPGGFAGLNDVNWKPRPGKDLGRLDNMPSYMLAETLMYAYIVQLEDEAAWQLKGEGEGPNEWVWSTQAHPLRVRGGLDLGD